MEHVHCFSSQGQVGFTLSLILGQIPKSIASLFIGLLDPFRAIGHLLLDFVNTFQGIHGLVQ